jgi:hypothetical protein
MGDIQNKKPPMVQAVTTGKKNKTNRTKPTFRITAHYGNERAQSTEQKNERKITKRKSNMSVGGDEPPDDKRIKRH